MPPRLPPSTVPPVESSAIDEDVGQPAIDEAIKALRAILVAARRRTPKPQRPPVLIPFNIQ